MIQPTRISLLMLKDKAHSVVESIDILMAKRQALIKEFLKAAVPFIKTRAFMRETYGKAVLELSLSIGHEGVEFVKAVAEAMPKEPSVEISEHSMWGVKYKEITTRQSPIKKPDDRPYDFQKTSAHLEEGIAYFEILTDAVLRAARYESKLKRLSDEIILTTRRVKVLQDRLLPKIRSQIRFIEQYMEERDRESYCRLKRVKGKMGKRLYAL